MACAIRPTNRDRTLRPSFLLVKTSSLGDVVHNLPVASDLARAYPGCRIDWIVEETFGAIPAMHANVDRVLHSAVRRWRRSLWRAETWREISDLRNALHERRYDAVIDTQGLLKSALLCTLAEGPRHGLDWRSSREPLALFYSRTHRVPWGQHAVLRNRELAARSLGFEPASGIDYGITAPAFPPAESRDDSPPDPDHPWARGSARFAWVPDGPFAVLLHATSADRKLWPEHQWKKLVAQLGADGVESVLPWGSPAEHERARRIASGLRHAHVPPRLGLHTMAGLLGRAHACVGVDTGLTHLAAALGRPTVGIYVSTDPDATGVLAPGKAVNVGGREGAPGLADVLDALSTVT
ncbi:MAG: lipopolysaccharide heptosyltransferase I [Betaproteobacteria bacterium]|nr:lipopolysaccharide heptosyltransferase I [Betaproteobacteria bacterium]